MKGYNLRSTLSSHESHGLSGTAPEWKEPEGRSTGRGFSEMRLVSGDSMQTSIASSAEQSSIVRRASRWTRVCIYVVVWWRPGVLASPSCRSVAAGNVNSLPSAGGGARDNGNPNSPRPIPLSRADEAWQTANRNPKTRSSKRQCR
ncbi:hypothetical protein PTTG_00905 [Puccinia triticina 1-1 BBBD Race 1]|uniref:Uncharacterized protein n=1 Tax=Puccinia triticina (isolate 1-1 / race 1 (BBBD)) TaxID=630390 RepID=A0A0C4EJI7_PUCT1|nr:hypothetical protein PTTG_00905 [Puccinia triticina 1-1 BBBD Race 1]